MDINIIINELIDRVPFIAKHIRLVKFQFSSNQDFIAIFQNNTIYYTKRLFLEFNHEEQLFILAHEISHFIINLKRTITDKTKNKNLLNFVEDAQINQILISYGLKAPKNIVLIDNALKYTEEELYNLYLPRISEIKDYIIPINESKRK